MMAQNEEEPGVSAVDWGLWGGVATPIRGELSGADGEGTPSPKRGAFSRAASRIASRSGRPKSSMASLFKPATLVAARTPQAQVKANARPQTTAAQIRGKYRKDIQSAHQ